ncbi:MAG TPA: hypothetical protein DCE56_02445 [Cyanobacteria bacterium UBA8553]|nr:hypothetical protein [Cyanobacteria bacterium UBA8553]
MNPTTRIIWSLAATLVCCFVPLLVLIKRANNQWSIREELRQSAQISATSRSTALGRAQYCIILNPKTPLTDGASVVYKIDKKRHLPSGQVVCDQYGNTALLDGSGRASDIQKAPFEEVNKILNKRKGLNEKRKFSKRTQR